MKRCETPLIVAGLISALCLASCAPRSRQPKSPSARRWQVSTLAGSGEKGFLDGPAESAQFAEPHGVAVDSQGNVYVADAHNQQVRRIAGGQATTLAGTGEQGREDTTIAASATFSYPAGVAVDGRWNVYVADVHNHCIRMISGGQVTTFAGSGRPGFADGPAAQAQFNEPYGVAVDGQGNVYVADAGNHRIRKVSQREVSTLAGSGTAGFADGPANAAQFNQPMGLAVDAQGNVYVADSSNHRIRRVSNRQVTTLAGSGELGFADGPAEQARFALPAGVTVDAQGNVYVADTANNRIRLIATGEVSTLAGSGAFGFSDGPAEVAEFCEPWGIAVDGDGNLYVGDSGNHRVRKVSPGGATSAAAERRTR